MIAGSPGRLGPFLLQLPPLLASLLVVLLSAVPLSLPGYGHIAVNAGLICVFHWAAFRSDLFPPAAAFALGLCQDVVTGAPLGLNALVFLVAYGVVEANAPVLRAGSYLGQWLGFALIALVAAALAWLATTILETRLIDPLPALFHVMVTAGAYPPLGWLLRLVRERFAAPNA